VPPPTPLYTAQHCRVAYKLYWSLTVFWNTPAPSADEWLAPLRAAVEADGVRILEHHPHAPTTSQFLLSSRPHVAPAQALRSVKGRLQYLLRDRLPRAFRRHYAIHSVGAVTQAVVRNYVHTQLQHHPMADDRVQQRLAASQIHAPDVDLARPRRSSHGEFSHNLHLVFVQRERWHEIRADVLRSLRAMLGAAARKKQHLLADAGLLADHVHLALGCDVAESPLDVALSYLNNLAFAQGMKLVYQLGCYLGTFGAYDLGAIRQHLDAEPEICVPNP
jgi:REP element-mobilizing transposase RayT